MKVCEELCPFQNINNCLLRAREFKATSESRKACWKDKINVIT